MVKDKRQQYDPRRILVLLKTVLLSTIFSFLLILSGTMYNSAAACVPCWCGGSHMGPMDTCCASAAEGAATCPNGGSTQYFGCPDLSNLPPDLAMSYTPFSGSVSCEGGGFICFGSCEDPCKGKDPCECDPDLCKCPDETSAGQ